MTEVQKSSLSSIATDPLRNFKFLVTIRPQGSQAIPIGFMTVSGLGMNIDVIPYREGGMNITTQNMPGQASFNPITFTHGLILNSTQPDIDWINQLFTVMQGSGTAGPGNNFRRIIDIEVLDSPVTTGAVNIGAQFRLYNAWPSSIAYADLDAGANQAFITQMTITHEGYAIQVAGSPTADVPGFTS